MVYKKIKKESVVKENLDPPKQETTREEARKSQKIEIIYY